MALIGFANEIEKLMLTQVLDTILFSLLDNLINYILKFTYQRLHSRLLIDNNFGYKYILYLSISAKNLISNFNFLH